jgi:hypothetical protein
LILAGETPPPRSGSLRERLTGGVDGSPAEAGDVDVSGADEAQSGAQRITIISARVDAVVAHGLYTPSLVPASGSTALPSSNSSPPTPAPELYQAYVVATPGPSSGAADAYARTRDLAHRTHLIDTYA